MGRTYRQLSVAERIEVQVQQEKGLSRRAIARLLKRSGSTVSREMRRNGAKAAPPAAAEDVLAAVASPEVSPKPSGYNAAEAQSRAARLSRKPRRKRKLVRGSAAWTAVLEQFAAGLSPEQAARTLKRMHPDDTSLHFSHETIYQAI